MPRFSTSLASIVLALAFVPASFAAPPSPSLQTLARTQSAAIISAVLARWGQQSGQGQPTYFAAGVWHSPNAYWPCSVGAGTAAALLWTAEPAAYPAGRDQAIQTFDTLIAQHQARAGNLGTDIQTMMAGVELGTTYLDLSSTLDAWHRRHWRSAIAAAADFLIANGNVTWYTNGNINIGNTDLFWLAWKATRATRFARAYEQSLRFTLAPPQNRWRGFGLHITRKPWATDGSDGAGYLAEKGVGAPGYDPDYTQGQADIAARLYVQSRDPRVLRLLNLLTNQLLLRVNGNFELDASGGSRHPQIGRHPPFLTPALVVLALAGRENLVTLAERQIGTIALHYSAASAMPGPNDYRGLGNQVGLMLQASAAR
jgi:hypothetical protein